MGEISDWIFCTGTGPDKMCLVNASKIDEGMFCTKEDGSDRICIFNPIKYKESHDRMKCYDDFTNGVCLYSPETQRVGSICSTTDGVCTVKTDAYAGIIVGTIILTLLTAWIIPFLILHFSINNK
jgi:hypothetical protein